MLAPSDVILSISLPSTGKPNKNAHWAYRFGQAAYVRVIFGERCSVNATIVGSFPLSHFRLNEELYRIEPYHRVLAAHLALE